MSIRARIAILLICLTVPTSAIIGGAGHLVLPQRLLQVGLNEGRISVTEESARLRRITRPVDALAPRGAIVQLADWLEENLEPAGVLPVVAAPRDVLDRVCQELSGDAIRHRDREACHIRVAARDRGDAYGFEIEDDGAGRPARFHRIRYQQVA